MIGKKLLRIVYFTDNGHSTAQNIEEGLAGYICEYKPSHISLKEWVRQCFEAHLPILFIGSTGIAVRSIAEFITDKLSDSAVIVVDELGLNVIPILSGHYGGANELALAIADAINANAVITTATDINNVFAIDVFAKQNGYRISDKNLIKRVSAKALKGEKLSVTNSNDFLEVEGLKLYPKKMVLGMGCKKGKDFKELLEFVTSHYDEQHLKEELYAICSIDVKVEEMGLIRLAAYFGVPFLCFSAEELKSAPGEYNDSEFVNETVGVGNVCERAAMLGAGEGAVLVNNKIALNGMTMAEAKRIVTIHPQPGEDT